MPEMMSSAGVAFDLNAVLDAIAGKQDKEADKKFQDEERARFLEAIGHERSTDAMLSTYGVSDTRIRSAYEMGTNADGDEAKTYIAIERLAEGLALKGDFREAAALAQDPTRKIEYERLAEARRKGYTECGCPTPAFFLKQKLFTGEKMLHIEECPKCRTLRCYEL